MGPLGRLNNIMIKNLGDTNSSCSNSSNNSYGLRCLQLNQKSVIFIICIVKYKV